MTAPIIKRKQKHDEVSIMYKIFQDKLIIKTLQVIYKSVLKFIPTWLLEKLKKCSQVFSFLHFEL